MSPSTELDRLKGKKILVAITGGIAAFKTATLVSRLVQAGAEVTALMTDAATKFVGPTTFQSLTGRPVYTSPWQSSEDFASQHVALARAADAMIIAPASANTLAKLAAGICDNVVTTVAAALPRSTTVLLAPAMNEQMWENPVTGRNLATLTDLLGYHTVGPDSGWQACRTKGSGRMSEPQAILDRVVDLLPRS